MDLLRERYGPRVGFELAGLLKQLRAGDDAKSLQMSTATFNRKRKFLKEAGLL